MTPPTPVSSWGIHVKTQEHGKPRYKRSCFANRGDQDQHSRGWDNASYYTDFQVGFPGNVPQWANQKGECTSRYSSRLVAASSRQDTYMCLFRSCHYSVLITCYVVGCLQREGLVDLCLPWCSPVGSTTSLVACIVGYAYVVVGARNVRRVQLENGCMPVLKYRPRPDARRIRHLPLLCVFVP